MLGCRSEKRLKVASLLIKPLSVFLPNRVTHAIPMFMKLNIYYRKRSYITSVIIIEFYVQANESCLCIKKIKVKVFLHML